MSSSSLELIEDDASGLVDFRYFEVSGLFIYQLSGFDVAQGRATAHEIKALSEWDAAARALRRVRSSIWGAVATDRRGPPFRFCTWIDVRVTQMLIGAGGKPKKKPGPKKRLKL
jgi:hypothetical protein